ncbi:MAG: hypothetical protein ACRBDI_02855 [Alphaproteobacteria bacterium]
MSMLSTCPAALMAYSRLASSVIFPAVSVVMGLAVTYSRRELVDG